MIRKSRISEQTIYLELVDTENNGVKLISIDRYGTTLDELLGIKSDGRIQLLPIRIYNLEAYSKAGIDVNSKRLLCIDGVEETPLDSELITYQENPCWDTAKELLMRMIDVYENHIVPDAVKFKLEHLVEECNKNKRIDDDIPF